MRRVYYVDPKRKIIIGEGLARLRETRRNIDPALLARIQDLIAKQENAINLDPHREDSSASPALTLPGKEPVDRKKILTTIQKFIELQAGKTDLLSRLRTIMAESLH